MSDNISLFGRTYAQLGSTKSDTIIRTRGQVKIQIGNTFIDLIKDNKLNVNCKFIYQADEVGTKDGIYVVDDEIWLVINGEQINLKGEIGDTYVSFLENQETTSEQKYNALTNIGFLNKDLDSISLKNGLVYVESEKKLYTIIDGNITEFTVSFPNPFREQFIIEKNDSNQGALLIKGQGVENSIALDNLWIYIDNDKPIIKSNKDISINDKLIISDKYSQFKNDVVSSMFKSENATSDKGFRLYYVNGRSTLEIDNLIVRNQSSDQNTLFPEYWFLNTNIIESVEDNILTVRYEYDYKVGDILTTFTINEDQQFSQIDYEITEVNGTQLTFENGSDEGVIGNYIFLTKTEDQIPIHLKDNNIDIAEQLRIGNLKDLNISIIDNQIEIPIEEHGIYSQHGVFTNAAYESNYNLPESDNSSRFASTEWVRKQLKNPGYYWSKENNNGIPVNPIFIGTDIGTFEVSQDKPYLWRTSDGVNFILADEYLNPLQDKVYIATTSYAYNQKDGIAYISPVGFIAYYSNSELICNLGKSNFLKETDKVSDFINNPDQSIVPKVKGYTYIWSSDQTLENWTLEQQNDINSSYVGTINGSDWGNSSAPPGYSLFEVDDNYRIVKLQYENKNGTSINWNDPEYQKYFLMTILADFFNKNQHKYNSNLGWSFSYDGPVLCSGYGGIWTARCSGTTPPTSDDPNDINYLANSGFSELQGYVMGYGYLIHFSYTDIKFGLLLPYVMSPHNSQIGEIRLAERKFYDVSYRTCSAIIKEYTINNIMTI